MGSFSFLSGLVSLTLFLSFTEFAYSAPSKRNIIENDHSKRQSNAPYPVVGVQTGEVLPRYEIRDLYNNFPDQWNVYILGLGRLHNEDQNDFLSYFSISGIHGLPHAPWNNIAGNQGSANPGYCTHASNLFLPWHRPYLALYEQVLVSHAQAAANEFPPGPARDRYLTAAGALRLPYWDWASSPPTGEQVTPMQLTAPMIQVITPNGTQTTDNPLYSYRFDPAHRQTLQYPPYINWGKTLRWPNSSDAGADSQPRALISSMATNNARAKSRLYTMLSTPGNFSAIGNPVSRASMSPGSFDSLESVHDAVHSAIGGTNYGDMTYIAVSAFDPAFWLHHTMMDRTWAIWQALYPDSYVQPMAQVQDSYWYSKGDILDGNTQLKPFASGPHGDFWTANQVRDHRVFKYTYKELETKDPASIISLVNSRYGPQSGPLSFRKLRRRNATVADSETRLYQINVRASKNSVQSSYFIDFFHGNPTNEDPATWPTDSNLIGTHTVMSMALPNLPTVKTTGVVALNVHLVSLVEQGALKTMDEVDVLPFLKKEMTWRVRQGNNQEVPLTELPDLEVSVASVGVVPAQSESEFPKFVGKWVTYPDITDGKTGGLGVS